MPLFEVAVNGRIQTVAACHGREVEMDLIFHTLDNTDLGEKNRGTR